MTNRDVPARPGDAVAVRTRTGAPWTSGDLEDAEPALTVSSLDTRRRWRRPLPFTLANGTVSAVTRRRLRRIPRHLATDTGRYAADSRPSGRTERRHGLIGISQAFRTTRPTCAGAWCTTRAGYASCRLCTFHPNGCFALEGPLRDALRRGAWPVSSGARASTRLSIPRITSRRVAATGGALRRVSTRRRWTSGPTPTLHRVPEAHLPPGFLATR